MVSHKGFIVIGYVYAILGTLSSVYEGIQTASGLASQQKIAPVDYALLPGSFITLVFFVILLVGLVKRNLTLVNVYRIYLKVANIIIIVGITIAIAVCIGLMLFTEKVLVAFGGLIIFCLLIALAIIIGYYFLVLWIVNGVIAAFESEQGTNGGMMYSPKSGGNNNPHIAPV